MGAINSCLATCYCYYYTNCDACMEIRIVVVLFVIIITSITIIANNALLLLLGMLLSAIIKVLLTYVIAIYTKLITSGLIVHAWMYINHYFYMHI